VAVDVPEDRLHDESPAEYVVRLASAKAQAGRRLRPEDPVLGADTVVVLDGAVFGKPRDRADALMMLKRLSGRCHEVYSGVALCSEGNRAASLSSVTNVWFRTLSSDEIEAYVASGEPLDKAGAYAIQGLAARFIERIDGSYSGVVGLPLFETAKLLGRVRLI
jgi:septum formation protein